MDPATVQQNLGNVKMPAQTVIKRQDSASSAKTERRHEQGVIVDKDNIERFFKEKSEQL